MGDINDDLRALVELCTQEVPRGMSIQNRYQWDDARAYEALRFIQQHGPALLARQEGEDARDAARYRWLRSQEEIIIRTDDFEWYPDDSYPATTKEGLDAAIDAARSGGGG